MNLSSTENPGPAAHRACRACNGLGPELVFTIRPPGFPCIGHSEANNQPFEIDTRDMARAQLVTVNELPAPVTPRRLRRVSNGQRG
jgi:hypothetical protein